MKKIFWCIQQLNYKGGAEQVSIDLANRLCGDYEITLVSTAAIGPEIVYNIDSKIKIESLNIPINVVKFDYFYDLNKREHKWWKNFLLICKLFFYFILKNHINRRHMSNITKGELTIASSLDCEMFAPFKGPYYVHFHFSGENYLSFGNRLSRLICRRPNKTILLSKSIYDDVTNHAINKNKFTYIYNCCRFDAISNTQPKGNKILFVGRFSQQKNPMLALEVAHTLRILGVEFTLDMFGDGPFKDQMDQYIKDKNLSDLVKLFPPSLTIEDEYKSHDVLLMTSLYEGSPLVINEARAFSEVVVTTKFKGNLDMIQNGDDGFIIDSYSAFDIANAIKVVLSKDLYLYKQFTFRNALNYSNSDILDEWKKIL